MRRRRHVAMQAFVHRRRPWFQLVGSTHGAIMNAWWFGCEHIILWSRNYLFAKCSYLVSYKSHLGYAKLGRNKPVDNSGADDKNDWSEKHDSIVVVCFVICGGFTCLAEGSLDPSFMFMLMAWRVRICHLSKRSLADGLNTAGSLHTLRIFHRRIWNEHPSFVNRPKIHFISMMIDLIILLQ